MLFTYDYSLVCLYCRGQVPAEAEASFLKKAASLDTYGVDPHKVKVAVITQAVTAWCKTVVTTICNNSSYNSFTLSPPNVIKM